ncbi:MAG: hypothetical protein WD118_08475, partial [Phycisphaeraceae bacterium]
MRTNRAARHTPDSQADLPPQTAHRLELSREFTTLLTQPGEQRRLHRLPCRGAVDPAGGVVCARTAIGGGVLEPVGFAPLRTGLPTLLSRVTLLVVRGQSVPASHRAGRFRIGLLLQRGRGPANQPLSLDLVTGLIVAAGAEHDKRNSHRSRPLGSSRVLGEAHILGSRMLCPRLPSTFRCRLLETLPDSCSVYVNRKKGERQYLPLPAAIKAKNLDLSVSVRYFPPYDLS